MKTVGNGFLLLWGTGADGTGGRTDPEDLASLDTSWSRDMLDWSPWSRACLLNEGEGSRSWFSAKSPSHPVILVGAVSSALDMGWHFLHKGFLPEWGCVLAAGQQKGRGQLRRAWHSPPGNMYAAVRIPPPPKSWDGLMPLLVGECVARGIEELGASILLKWPNDLLLAGKKIGGILIEERNGLFLAGIGINLTRVPSAQNLRGPESFRAGSLREAGISATPLTLWLKLVQAIGFCYQSTISSLPPSEFVAGLQARLAFRRRKITVAGTGTNPIRGSLMGLSPDGGLVLLKADGSETVIHSGSILPGPG